MRSRDSNLLKLGLSSRGRSSFLALIVASSLVPSAASAQVSRGAAPTPPPPTGSQRLELCPCPAQDVVIEGDDRALARQRDPQTQAGTAGREAQGIGVGVPQGEPLPNRDIVLEEDYGLATAPRDPQTPAPDGAQRIQGEPIPNRDVVIQGEGGRLGAPGGARTPTPDRRRGG